ncbi:MAG: transcription factor [Dethiosulfovibrio peptidovorans]|nr:MAG: transcription factor [Dethiosulfovibrio peptidovorans]
MAKSINRKIRHERLSQLIRQNPLLSDEGLAASLGVSVSTVRLDRALLGFPELRERARRMAERATSKLQSLKQEEFIGELMDLELNRWAFSVLKTRQEMAFRHTEFIWDHYIYAQASSLAIAVVGADMVIVGSVRGRFRAPARIGDVLMAKAKVGVHKGNKYIVSVRTRVGEREIFVGRYIVVALESREENKIRGESP